MTAHIAIIDDEPRMVEVTAMVLRRAGHRVTGFTDPAAFLAMHEDAPFDLVLTDLRMPGTDGLSLARRALQLAPDAPVLLMTAHATVQTAVQALREGVFDYIQKPFDNDDLRITVARALEQTRLARENRYLRAQVERRASEVGVVAHSDAMRRVLELARRVAQTPSTVLLLGESGTGKEVLARALHAWSPRVAGPLVAVNVGAIAGSLLEGELFGHEKGAFTGADKARPGVFEQAHGGTLLLDEIGELPEDAQVKLLRVLQERELRRVGATAPRAVDVRVIAATNRDLKALVDAGRFREDLYFRLAVIPLRLPPLRERPEDVPALAAHFLRRANDRLGRRLEGFTPEVEAWMLQHRWPGNVRELENTVERGAALAIGPKIEVADLLLELSPADVAPGAGGDLQSWLDQAAAVKIREALRAADGARAEAARLLGVDRTTLYRLIKRLGLEEP